MRVKASKLREMTDDELDGQLAAAQRELFDLRVKKRASQVDQPLRIRTLRREIARMRTVLRQRAVVRDAGHAG